MNEEKDGFEELADDTSDFLEETAAEFTASELPVENYAEVDTTSVSTGGSAIGFVGILMAILSFFWMPWLFGFGAVLFGIIAARRATALGVTAIVIGSISIIMQMFYYFGYWY